MKTIKSIFFALTIALFSSCESEQLEDNSSSILDVEATSLTEKGGCNDDVLRNNVRYSLVVRNRRNQEETFNIPARSIDSNTRRGIAIDVRLRDVFSRQFLSSGVNRIILRSRASFQFPTSLISQPGVNLNDGSITLFQQAETNLNANSRLNAVTRVPGRFAERDLNVFYQISCGRSRFAR